MLKLFRFYSRRAPPTLTIWASTNCLSHPNIKHRQKLLSLSGMLSTRICSLHILGGILKNKMLQHKRGWTSGSISEQLFWIIYTTFYPYHTTLSASTLIYYIICKNLEIFNYTFFSKNFFWVKNRESSEIFRKFQFSNMEFS
jgi:hypothetical protein